MRPSFHFLAPAQVCKELLIFRQQWEPAPLPSAPRGVCWPAENLVHGTTSSSPADSGEPPRTRIKSCLRRPPHPIPAAQHPLPRQLPNLPNHLCMQSPVIRSEAHQQRTQIQVIDLRPSVSRYGSAAPCSCLKNFYKHRLLSNPQSFRKGLISQENFE